jgi:hypothetical protein
MFITKSTHQNPGRRQRGPDPRNVEAMPQERAIYALAGKDSPNKSSDSGTKCKKMFAVQNQNDFER